MEKYVLGWILVLTGGLVFLLVAIGLLRMYFDNQEKVYLFLSTSLGLAAISIMLVSLDSMIGFKSTQFLKFLSILLVSTMSLTLVPILLIARNPQDMLA